MRHLLKLAAISALLCFILTSASQAQLANAKIAFASNRDGNFYLDIGHLVVIRDLINTKR